MGRRCRHGRGARGLHVVPGQVGRSCGTSISGHLHKVHGLSHWCERRRRAFRKLRGARGSKNTLLGGVSRGTALAHIEDRVDDFVIGIVAAACGERQRPPKRRRAEVQPDDTTQACPKLAIAHSTIGRAAHCRHQAGAGAEDVRPRHAALNPSERQDRPHR